MWGGGRMRPEPPHPHPAQHNPLHPQSPMSNCLPASFSWPSRAEERRPSFRIKAGKEDQGSRSPPNTEVPHGSCLYAMTGNEATFLPMSVEFIRRPGAAVKDSLIHESRGKAQGHGFESRPPTGSSQRAHHHSSLPLSLEGPQAPPAWPRT